MTTQPGARAEEDTQVEVMRVRQTSTVPPDLTIEVSSPGSDVIFDLNSTLTVNEIPFVVTDLDSAVAQIVANRIPRQGRSIRLANAYSVALTSQDLEYKDLMTHQGVNLPDGTPVYWAMRNQARRSSVSPPGAVRGPTLFVRTLDVGRAHGVSHFFLGSSEETLDALVRHARQRFPGIRVAGVLSPPYAPMTTNSIEQWAEVIRQSGADLVWVSLGTPKQDFATTHLAPLVGRHCIGVGAAFDFLAQTQREAPSFIRGTGFEWLYRLMCEPRRLWRRYLFGNARFLRMSLGTSFKRRVRQGATKS